MTQNTHILQGAPDAAPAPRTDNPADARWMRRCLEIARHGCLGAAPNPMVGAVLVHRERIIGEGWHRRCGEAHAEVNAFRGVREADRALISEATLYVSLEPCAHYGRTPPCAELIVRNRVARVVVGCVDPFARVAGRGIEMIRQAGIEVTVGVLEDECLALNSHFICQHAVGRPFITLKWARSADGFIDSCRETADIKPARLSTRLSILRTHYLRATSQAILVGHRTLTLDRPGLSTRYWPGQSPMRLALGGIGIDELVGDMAAYADIDSLLEDLSRQGVQSLLVEGGTQTLQSFIERDLWDEAWEECSTIRLGSGVAAPQMPEVFVPEVETHYGVTYNHWQSPLLQHNYRDFL